MQKQTSLNRAAAFVGVTALLFAPYASVPVADAGTATSVTTTLVDTATPSIPSTITFAFTPTTPLASGGSILLNIPVGFTATTWSNVDVAAVQTGATFGAATVSGSNAAGGTITIPVTTAGTGAVTVTIGSTTKLINPDTKGQYTLQVTTRNASGVVADTGYALANVSNTVAVSTQVAEALVMTLTSGTSLNFNVDPSVNDGVDRAQSSTLNVKTNATTYSIRADLTGATSNDGLLCLNGTCGANRQISSATTGEDTIAFTPVEGADDAGTNPAHVTQAGTATFGAAGNIATGATGLKNNRAWRVSYDLDVDYAVLAGNYTGTIAYTATPSF